MTEPPATESPTKKPPQKKNRPIQAAPLGRVLTALLALRSWRVEATQRLLLLTGVALAITVLVSPNLALWPERYREGELITRDVILPEAVSLVDERSTQVRIQEALAALPPVYDHDSDSLSRRQTALAAQFQAARQRLRETETLAEAAQQALSEAWLAHLETIARRSDEVTRYRAIQAVRDVLEPPPDTAGQPTSTRQTEKQRIDLLMLKAQLTEAEQRVTRSTEQLTQQKAELARLAEQSNPLEGAQTEPTIALQRQWQEALAVRIEAATLESLQGAGFNENIERAVLALVEGLAGRLILADKTLSELPKAIDLHDIANDEIRRLEDPAARIRSVSEVQELIQERAATLVDLNSLSGGLKETAIALAQLLIQPNLTPNKSATEDARQALLANLSPLYFTLQKGDVLARAGDIATPEQAALLQALDQYRREHPRYPQLLGTFALLWLLLGGFYQTLRRARLNTPLHSLRAKWLLIVLLILPLLLTRFLSWLGATLDAVYTFIPSFGLEYLAPFALTSMLCGVIFGFLPAVLLGLLQSFQLALLLDGALPLFAYGTLLSLVAALPLRQFETRGALWEQGLRVALTALPALLIVLLLHPAAPSLKETFPATLFSALLGVLFSTLLTITLLPFLERVFDITTNLRLLELSNTNHPLLKQLSMRAPGTYHHSVMVGNMAESVAPRISANPLLVRVAALYHDVGKMEHADYFIENQPAANNPHDRLTPQRSVEMITAHVQDGLTLAKKYRLGRAVSAIIAQHHGDSVLRYFYHRAQEEAQGEAVRIEDYRYAGPRPNTREAALVMLADIVEATVRSNAHAEPAQVHETVVRVTNRVCEEAQLDECGLTFADLRQIQQGFIAFLNGMHHQRIRYPDLQLTPQHTERAAQE